MSKTKDLAENFLQKVQTSQAPSRMQPINPFNSLFEVQELSEKESNLIDKILIDGYTPGMFNEESVAPDLVEIKKLTKELKAIQRQEIVLIGERIFKAKEIFNKDKYKEESFKEWLEFTFGSYKTGYNYLSFYKLYLSLPDPLKFNLKDMPAKAVYVLASKDAPLEKKAHIIEKHASETANNLITIIQDTLGTDKVKKSNRKPVIDKLIISIEKEVLKLVRRKDQLDPGQRQRITYLIDLLQQM